MKLKIKKLIPDLDLRYHSDGASGIDIPVSEEFTIYPMETVKISCDFCVEIPHGYEGQIRPRSSLSKDGILVHYGTVDSDYRGPVGVIMSNTKHSMITYKKGERIAQLVIAPVQRCEIEFVDELSETKRGNGGFGSTGK